MDADAASEVTLVEATVAETVDVVRLYVPAVALVGMVAVTLKVQVDPAVKDSPLAVNVELLAPDMAPPEPQKVPVGTVAAVSPASAAFRSTVKPIPVASVVELPLNCIEKSMLMVPPGVILVSRMPIDSEGPATTVKLAEASLMPNSEPETVPMPSVEDTEYVPGCADDGTVMTTSNVQFAPAVRLAGADDAI